MMVINIEGLAGFAKFLRKEWENFGATVLDKTVAPTVSC